MISHLVSELSPPDIEIELAYTEAERQWLIARRVPAGTTVGEALKLVAGEFPAVDTQDVGIFGRHCRLEQVLQQGDRIEIYRPLVADAKQQRRERAALARNAAQSKS